MSKSHSYNSSSTHTNFHQSFFSKLFSIKRQMFISSFFWHIIIDKHMTHSNRSFRQADQHYQTIIINQNKKKSTDAWLGFKLQSVALSHHKSPHHHMRKHIIITTTNHHINNTNRIQIRFHLSRSWNHTRESREETAKITSNLL